MQLQSVRYGHLPGVFQTVWRAEAPAVLQAVLSEPRAAAGEVATSVRVFNDNAQAVADAAAFGSVPSPDGAKRPHASIWRRVRTALLDGRELNVAKVRAHVTFEAGALEGQPAWQSRGNGLADLWAGWGARRHRAPAATRAAVAAAAAELTVRLIVMAAVVRLASSGTSPWPTTRPAGLPRDSGLTVLPEGFVRHTLSDLPGGGVRCVACRRMARTAASRAALAASSCTTFRARASTGIGHARAVSACGLYTFCLVCGSYAAARVRGLAGHCSGAPSAVGT